MSCSLYCKSSFCSSHWRYIDSKREAFCNTDLGKAADVNLDRDHHSCQFTCVRVCVRAYARACVHSWERAYVRVCAGVMSCVCTCVRAYVRVCVCA